MVVKHFRTKVMKNGNIVEDKYIKEVDGEVVKKEDYIKNPQLEQKEVNNLGLRSAFKKALEDEFDNTPSGAARPGFYLDYLHSNPFGNLGNLFGVNYKKIAEKAKEAVSEEYNKQKEKVAKAYKEYEAAKESGGPAWWFERKASKHMSKDKEEHKCCGSCKSEDVVTVKDKFETILDLYGQNSIFTYKNKHSILKRCVDEFIADGCSDVLIAPDLYDKTKLTMIVRFKNMDTEVYDFKPCR